MKKNIFIAFLCLLLCTNIFAGNDKATIFDTIMNRVCEREFARMLTPRISKPEFSLVLPNADGAYSDIDLSDTKPVSWTPIEHLIRIGNLAVAYTCPQSKRYKDTLLYNSIYKGLQRWYDAHPRSSNWWHMQIGSPQQLGTLLILMRKGPKAIPAELENKLLQRMEEEAGNPQKWTGANKMDIALHWIYQACLKEDMAKLNLSVSEAYQPIALSTKEGYPQHDYSFHQHGDQLYIGGYGDVFLFDLASVASLMRGTNLAPKASQIRLLHRFTFESALPVIRGRYRLYNVQGRSMSRSKGLDMGDSIQNIASLMRDIDLPEYQPDYDAAIARLLEKKAPSYGIKPYHRQYWRSAYALHQRPEFTIDVRLKSTLSCGNENGNEENLKGYFLSDGGMDIATDGDEYKDLFPAWNWNMIPGVTAPQLAKIPTYKSWGAFGESRFAGGVDDGTCGVTAYNYRDNNQEVRTQGKKGWFFFDNAVVCLGADIASDVSADVYTTINQCRKKGAVYSKLLKGNKGKYQWVWHRGIGYYFPGSAQVCFSEKESRGAWAEFNKSQSKEEVKDSLFTLWINHGNQPRNATYAYTIIPGSKEKVKTARNYRILSNTSDIQAVQDGEKGPIGIIFYKPGTFKMNKVQISSDSPCVLWLKPVGKDWQVYAADPSHELSEMQLRITLPRLGTHEIHYSLQPHPDAYAGATIQAELTSASPMRIEARFDKAPWQYD